jgi:hypothetical protein
MAEEEFTFEGREITVQFNNKPFEVRLEKSRYKNGQLAVFGVNPDDDEIFCELTIHIPDLKNPGNKIYVWDCILHKNFIEALKNSGWFKTTSVSFYSETVMGFTEVWEPTVEKQNARKQCYSKWKCPLCKHIIEGLTFVEIAIIGTPICKNCDMPMDFSEEYIK